MSGLMRCAGCGEAVGVKNMQTVDSMNDRAYCGKPECQRAWVESLPKRKGHELAHCSLHGDFYSGHPECPTCREYSEAAS